MPIPVLDGQGKVQSRRRFLIQTGTGDVSFNPTSIPNGKAYTSATVLVAINVNKRDVPETWETLIADPVKFLKE